MDLRRLVLTTGHRGWARFFEIESRRIAEALAFLSPTIEHVGSTAVPGLLSKPIVDIGVAVGGIGDLPRAVDPLVNLGYVDRGRNGDDPLRRYFVLQEGTHRLAQLHLWTQDAAAWRQALAFRDLLRAREDLRRRYAEEKRRVAREVGWDKKAYSAAKSSFLADVLEEWIR